MKFAVLLGFVTTVGISLERAVEIMWEFTVVSEQNEYVSYCCQNRRTVKPTFVVFDGNRDKVLLPNCHG